jgi:hypothetical protein
MGGVLRQVFCRLRPEKLAFNLLGESQTANRHRFQPALTLWEFLNFESPRFASLALIKQAAEYFRLGESELTRKCGRHCGSFLPMMELLHRYSGLKVSVVYRVPDGLNGLNGLNDLNEQWLIAEPVWRFG